MNIRSVSRIGAVQDVAHQSAFVYGVDRGFLPPKSPSGKTQNVTLDGSGNLDTVYRFRQIEGWLGDVPVSFTYLMAYRSYEYTKQVFSQPGWGMANTSVNSWLV